MGAKHDRPSSEDDNVSAKRARGSKFLASPSQSSDVQANEEDNQATPRPSPSNASTRRSQAAPSLRPADFTFTRPPVVLRYGEDPSAFEDLTAEAKDLIKGILRVNRNPADSLHSSYWAEHVFDPPENSSVDLSPTPEQKAVYAKLQRLHRTVLFKLSLNRDEANWLDQYKHLWECLMETKPTKAFEASVLSMEETEDKSILEYNDIGFMIEDITLSSIHSTYKQMVPRPTKDISATTKKNDLALTCAPGFSNAKLSTTASALNANANKKLVFNPFADMRSSIVCLLTMEAKSANMRSGTPMSQAMSIAVVNNILWRNKLWRWKAKSAYDMRLPDWPVIMMVGPVWELYLAKDLSLEQQSQQQKINGRAVMLGRLGKGPDGSGDSAIHFVRVGELGNMYSVQSLHALMANLRAVLEYTGVYVWKFQKEVIHGLSEAS